jgi:hypothetical protein
MSPQKWVVIGVAGYILALFVSLMLSATIPIFGTITAGMGIALGILGIMLCIGAIIGDNSDPLS